MLSTKCLYKYINLYEGEIIPFGAEFRALKNGKLVWYDYYTKKTGKIMDLPPKTLCTVIAGAPARNWRIATVED